MIIRKEASDFENRIIVALDVKNETEALSLIERFENKIRFVKVGMELFYGTGYTFIEKLKQMDFKIFLDLKMHDIPNTVGRASAQLTRLGVDMFNLHVAGGIKMMENARSEMEKNLVAGQEKPLLIGVTQLTSTDEKMLREEIGIAASVEETVTHYAGLAKKAGLDGVVSSPLEVEAIKDHCGPSFITVTPGIRLKGGESHDQKRINTPVEAFQQGSDYIVIGRAITEAKEPAKVFEDIISDLNSLK